MLKRIDFSWMSIVKFSVFPLALGVVSLGSVAQAQFQLIDDFQGGTIGDPVVNLTTPNVGAGATWDGDPDEDTVHTFESDPDCQANIAMRIEGNGLDAAGAPLAQNSAVTRAQLNTPIAFGDTGTLFYRFRVPEAAAGTLDHVIGLTDNPTITNFNFKSGLRHIGNNDYDLRDGGAYEQVATGLTDNTWYRLWMVATNTNPGTHACYLQRDDEDASLPFGTQTLLVSGGDAFDFRINGATDIVNIYFRGANNVGGAMGNDLFFDDIYVNPTAADLSNPAVAVTPCMVMSVLKGDVDLSETVDFSDIGPFIAVLQSGGDQPEADCNCDNVVDFGDIPAFIAILQGQ